VTPARTRFLLVLAVAVLGVSVWLIVGHQRTTLLRGQEQTAGAGDLLTAMLDQETGVRGYDVTGLDEFLESYPTGRDNFDTALAAAYRRTHEPAIRDLLRQQTDIARRWQALADEAVAQVTVHGTRALGVRGARERKELMDRFRRENGLYRDLVRASARDDIASARWTAIGFVVLFGTVLLGGGLLVVERSARAGSRRRRIEQEFSETLQGADDEIEAQQLLRRHVERAVPGASAVVLSRSVTGEVLTASTDTDAVPGLAERLQGAAPRACLAVRRGTSYARSAGKEPLQPCTLCGDLPGSSQCTPALVGGEVMGSVLLVRARGVSAAAGLTLIAAVNQSAPVLANLRNLAVAEHRAATDGLTGLPNARSVREALTRMAAHAARTSGRLSAIALDLDHFKSLNDRYGHQSGDEVLAHVGAALRSGLRTSDFAGRWGGEEFVVLLPDTDAMGAAEAAEKVRELIGRIRLPSVPVAVTASLGVAAMPEHAGEPDELLRAADRALYAAKAAGRDCVVVAGAQTELPVIASTR
jgi:diguanylate cyclase (GGDEF)-like protein